MIRPILISATLLILGSQLAFAQPAPDNAPKAENPANTNRAPQTPEQKEAAAKQMEEVMRKGQDAFQKTFADMARMTPEQQREELRKIQEKGLRQTFDRAGFKDLKLQDRIIAFIAEQEKSREKVRKAAAKVYLALEPQGIPTNKQGMTILLVNYLNVTDDAKAERETMTKALEKELDLTSNPNLMALLTLQGIIGESSWFTSDVSMLGSMSIGALAPYVNPAQ